MSPTPFTLLFATALVASLAVKLWLATRQMRHVAAHRAAVPLPFAGQVSLADHQRAADYTLAKGRFGLLVMAVGHGVLLGWTLLGGFDVLNNLLRNAVEPRFGAMAYQLALLSAFALIGGAIDLPFEIYSTFRIEQQFGFNRNTARLYIADLLKGLLVGALIGLPLAAAVLWIMGATGALWWLWAWGTWAGFNLLVMVLYPTVIAPLFNKFEPLADEALSYADIVMDLVAHRVTRAGKPLHLGPTEFRLLRHFMEHPGRVFSREQLLDSVWGKDVYVEARTVDVHIRRLRMALNGEGSADLIRTVRAAGYALDATPG